MFVGDGDGEAAGSAQGAERYPFVTENMVFGRSGAWAAHEDNRLGLALLEVEGEHVLHNGSNTTAAREAKEERRPPGVSATVK